MRCMGCGARASGYTGYCRSCKGAIARGAKRAEAEGILVDFAGGAAWAWNSRGDVLAGPAENKSSIWMELDRMRADPAPAPETPMCLWTIFVAGVPQETKAAASDEKHAIALWRGQTGSQARDDEVRAEPDRGEQCHACGAPGRGFAFIGGAIVPACKEHARPVPFYGGEQCYACDARPVGLADRRHGAEGELVVACQRHADPTIKTYDACIYCTRPVHKGSFVIEGEFAHKSCHREAER